MLRTLRPLPRSEGQHWSVEEIRRGKRQKGSRGEGDEVRMGGKLGREEGGERSRGVELFEDWSEMIILRQRKCAEGH